MESRLTAQLLFKKGGDSVETAPDDNGIIETLIDPKRANFYCQELAKQVLGRGVKDTQIVIGVWSFGETMAHLMALHLSCLDRRTKDVLSLPAKRRPDGQWSVDPKCSELARGQLILVVIPGHRGKEERIPDYLMTLVKEAGGILQGVLYYDGAFLSPSAGEYAAT